jgi:hypothetical protein
MIRPLVQSVSPPPNAFDPTFVDAGGVTHETLSTDRDGDVSLCGRFRQPSKNRCDDLTLRAFAWSLAPEGVDCMSCLVNRARLDSMIQGPQVKSGHLMVEMDLAAEAAR